MLIIPKWNRFSFELQFWMTLWVASLSSLSLGPCLFTGLPGYDISHSVTPHYLLFIPHLLPKGFFASLPMKDAYKCDFFP